MDKTELAAIPKDMAAMITTSRPEGRDDGVLGTEGIGQDDILIPRLAVCQKTSPELDPTNPRYIEGIQFTDLFNTLTKKNFKKGPVHFIVLRRDDPRGVEFRPLDQGGGIIDPHVALSDPRMQFGAFDPVTGKSAKPIATKYYDFMALILTDMDAKDPLQSVAGLSFKGSGLKAAKRLNMLIMQRGPKKVYKGVYSISSGSESSDNKTWAVFKVGNAGWVTPGSALESMAAEMHEAWQTMKVKIDMATETPDDAGDATFDPVALEREAQRESAPTDM